MKGDLEEVCYEGKHKFWSLGLALPSLIVWGLGIPLFALILLLQNKKKLDSHNVREKYGFLFRGYKLKYFFWEVVVIYRKITLIFIQVFIHSVGDFA